MADKTPGTGGFYQVRADDWDYLNTALRLMCNRLDALEGRRGTVPLGSNIDLNSKKVINAADPTASTDYVTKGYADANYGAQKVWQDLIISGRFPLPATAIAPGSAAFVEKTHAERITSSFQAGSYPIGAGFWETDRTVMYLVVDSGGVRIWQYAGGHMKDALSNRPTDLGADDAGFRFVSTDTSQATAYTWNGSAWVTIGGFLQEVADAGTNTTTTVHTRRHSTSGAAANGFGLGVTDSLEDSAGTLRDAAFEETTWANAGTTSALKRWSLRVVGTLTALMGLEANGNLSIIGDYLWKSATGFFGTLAHANTVNRTYTFPDADGSVVYENGGLPLGNFIGGVGGAQIADQGFSIVPVTSGGTGSSAASGARSNLGAATAQAPGAHTFPIPKLTGGGANGSISWEADGVISSYVDPT